MKQPAAAMKETTMADLADYTDDQLRAELQRREQERNEERWVKMRAWAKHLCPFCGGPDGWHERGCVSDALDTVT